VEHPAEPNAIVGLAGVEAHGFLVDVAEEVEGLDADVGSVDSALQEAPKVLQSIRVDLAVNVLYRMIDHLMLELVKAAVGLQGIRVECCPGFDVLPDFGLKRFLFAIRNHSGADGAVLSILAAFEDSHNCGLILAAGAGDLSGAYCLVHVARFLADESFIGFDMASQFVRPLQPEGNPNPMIHEPRSFLRDLQRPRYLGTAHAVLAVRHKPRSHKPLVQAERGLLIGRSGFQRELPFRVLVAAPLAVLIHQEDYILASAGRALHAVPASAAP
jgi:hypothetical protein